ncbi:MAG: hypothetical protein ABSE22_01135 [Xanthobacteraceae bacterium]|jgi:hypothetical protein
MTDLLGYAASCAVLATFLMRTMVPLRLIGILSNVLFLGFGYAQHIYPVFFLHLALLPINAWRLFVAKEPGHGQSLSLSHLPDVVAAPRPYTFWFAVGLLAGLIGSLAIIVLTNVEPV